MRKNIVGKSAVPEGPYEQELICVPIAIIPQALGALDLKGQKYWYQTPEDWARGRSLLAYLGASMLLPCGKDIVNAVDRLYVSFEAHLVGIARSASPDLANPGSFVYAPALEQSANALDAVAPSLRADVEKSAGLLDNLVTGASNAYASDPDGLKQLVRQLITAVQAQEDNSETTETLLNLILLALG